MRGRGPFDPASLIEHLDGDLKPVAAATDYQRFYGFTSVCEHAEHRMARPDLGGEYITLQTFVPESAVATAVLCHGYYDHTGLFAHLIDFLVSQGVAVLSFDQPGHGLSSGPRATIGSFDTYVHTLDAVLARTTHLPGPRHLIGQSMGGAVAMEYLAGRTRTNFEEVILLAPLLRPYQWPTARWVYRAARLVQLKSRPRTITENAENEEFLSLMHADPLQPDILPVQWVKAMVEWMGRFERYGHTDIPVRMIQGDDDKTVDGPWGIERVAERFHLDLLVVEGGRHHLCNESEEKRQRIWDWLEHRCEWEGGRR